VAFGFYFREDACDLTFAVDQERGALNAHDLFPVHVLFLDHAEGIADFLVGVGEERVREVVFFFELLLFFRSVSGDAENYGAGLLYLLECVAEPARFYRSTRCVSLGIEEQNYVLPVKIF